MVFSGNKTDRLTRLVAYSKLVSFVPTLSLSLTNSNCKRDAFRLELSKLTRYVQV